MELQNHNTQAQQDKKTSLRKSVAPVQSQSSPVQASTLVPQAASVPQESASQNTAMRRKSVYTVVRNENSDKGFWVRIGVGFVNRDDSLNIYLHALPVNGQIHIRDYEPENSRDGAESR